MAESKIVEILLLLIAGLLTVIWWSVRAVLTELRVEQKDQREIVDGHETRLTVLEREHNRKICGCDRDGK